jgi:hypothetical protein
MIHGLITEHLWILISIHVCASVSAFLHAGVISICLLILHKILADFIGFENLKPRLIWGCTSSSLKRILAILLLGFLSRRIDVEFPRPLLSVVNVHIICHVRVILDIDSDILR